MATENSKEISVKHVKIADVTSMEEAKSIFIKNTSEIRRKKKFNLLELQQIHIITYSLEKSVSYLVENLKDERQYLAKKIAVSVEDIHVNAENNRPQKTIEHLNKYLNLADKFISVF